jgi:hypothetical protein
MFFMLELQFTATFRFTETDIDIYHEGEQFYSRTFRFDNLTGSSALSVVNLDIDIDDTDQTLSAILCGEDIRNKTAILYLGVIANHEVAGAEWESGISWESGVLWMPSYTAKVQIIEEFMRYIVGGWELREDSLARLSLTNELILWNKNCLRNQSASCQWVFKGTECGYTGEQTWCDQSYERCRELNNEINYIGNRFLPALIKSELWWGRTPDYAE